MNIVFQCDRYFPNAEAPARRITGLAENLVKFGNNVDVICPLPDYVDGKKRKHWFKTRRIDEEINGVKVHRCFCVPFCNGGTVKRLLYQYSYRFSSKHVKLNNPDIIITSTPPLISCKSAVSIAKKYKAKLVVDIRDIWPDVAIEMGFFGKNSFKAKSFDKIANYLYKNADLITTVSKTKVIHLNEKLARFNKKAILMSNGIDSFFVKQEQNNSFLKEFEFDKFFSVIHVGKIGYAQDLDSLLDLAKYCLDKKDIRFFLIGDGVMLNHILERIEKESITNVMYCGVRSMSECLTAYKNSKLTYVSLVNEKLTDSVPTKLYETLFCGCPCLLSACGESADVVKESKFGLQSNPGDLSKLITNFESLYNNYGEIYQYKQYCYDYILKNYDRENVAAALNKELSTILNK